MTYQFTLLFILSLFICPPFDASAQLVSFPPERRVIFACLSWDDEIETLHFQTLIKDPKARSSVSLDKSTPLILSTGEVKIASSFRSELQPYLGPAVIEFFTSPPLPDPASSDQVAKPVASVLLPPDQSRLLLLFFKQTATTNHNGQTYRIEILPDNLDELPMGGYLMINTTGKKLIGRSGKQSFEVPAHSSKPLPTPSDASQKLEWFFWNEAHKDKPLYSSVWQHRSDSRTLVFITDSDEQRGALAIKAIQDIGVPATPKEEAPPIPK
ncbi:MAG: hypothetical protein RL693_1126 [Verrucomicrobiota bacterium]|jgi:hypothetical protein